jgi:hypothetical protein
MLHELQIWEEHIGFSENFLDTQKLIIFNGSGRKMI